MKLYDTLSRQLSQINPQRPPEVTVYTCGPTVYDYPHIGNWFTFIRYDILIRTLKAAGLRPRWALNITDVGHLVSDADEGEDKLEKGARREGKSAWEVADFYTDYFMKGLERLNFTKPDLMPRATQHIGEQIELIRILEEKGYTYRIDDGIYYDTVKFPAYIDFARLDLDEQQAGARIEHNPQKRRPADFALWKFSPKDHQRDMEWDSPWGKGFPGWHIECSAMIRKYFGNTVDIHSGGIDHLPVHHTNEVAQSQAATGQPLAGCWMHTNHILVDDEKISKSKSNGITLEDIEAKGYSLEAFRLLVLTSHYKSQSAFSWEILDEAAKVLQKFQAWSDMRFQNLDSPSLKNNYAEAVAQIMDELNNDLNTPKALALLNGMVNRSEDLGPDSKAIKETALKIDSLLGLNLSRRKDISDEQKELIASRETARTRQDWQESDQLREQLSEQGIEINDTERGPIWYRK
jgi:cysteinyl-tRNA synthetase